VRETGLGPLCLHPRSAAAFFRLVLQIGLVLYAACAAGFKSNSFAHKNKKDVLLDIFFVLVRETGLEPVRQRHTPLKRACLPIPALALNR